MNQRIIIASGGTGGHFYPGLALGKAFRARHIKVLFIVRKDDPAVQILKKNNFNYREIDFMGLPRSVNPLRHLRFTGKFFKALAQTRQIVKKFHPDVALGMGGYISFPLIFTAHFMGIKTAVHDSNAKLGLANKICGKFTDLFMLGLPLYKKRRRNKKMKLMSTPIRPEFAEDVDRNTVLSKLHLDPARKTVFVVGGSQGARNLNAAVVKLAEQLQEWQFIHLTGEKWYQDVRKMYGDNPRVAVLSYSHKIYELMKVSDVAICRSGASTLAELMYCQLPAVLVPFPHAAGNHQYYNAKILADGRCAIIAQDDKKLFQRLVTAFNQVSNPRRLSAMRYAYLRLNIPNPIRAARNIARLLMNL